MEERKARNCRILFDQLPAMLDPLVLPMGTEAFAESMLYAFASASKQPSMGGIGKRLKNMTCPSFRVELAKRRRSHSQLVDDPISITVCVHALKDGGIIDGQDIQAKFHRSNTTWNDGQEAQVLGYRAQVITRLRDA